MKNALEAMLETACVQQNSIINREKKENSLRLASSKYANLWCNGIIQEKIDNAKTNWKHLVGMNVSKAHFICNDKNEVPDESNSQLAVFTNQLSKYVETEECKVAILNAFPIFLFDYFGRKIINGIKLP